MTESPNAPPPPNQAGPYPGAPQPYWAFTGVPPTPPKNGLGTASLIVGIIALAVSFTLVGGVVLGFVALIIGLAARSRVRRSEATNCGVAIAGIALGTVAAVVPVIIVLALVFGTEAFNEDYQHCIGYHPGHEQSCDQYR